MYKVKFNAVKNKDGSINAASSSWVIEKPDGTFVNDIKFAGKPEADEYLERLKSLGYDK